MIWSIGEVTNIASCNTLAVNNSVHNNVKRGPGVATFRSKLLDFSQVLHINCLKICIKRPLARKPWSSVRGPWASWLLISGPGLPGRQLGTPGPPGCWLGALGPLGRQLGGPPGPSLSVRGPLAPWLLVRRPLVVS